MTAYSLFRGPCLKLGGSQMPKIGNIIASLSYKNDMLQHVVQEQLNLAHKTSQIIIYFTSLQDNQAHGSIIMVPCQRDKELICLLLGSPLPHPISYHITSHPYLLPNIHYKLTVMEALCCLRKPPSLFHN